jgi:Uncharacterized protein conserved in bacteria (DUF2252)
MQAHSDIFLGWTRSRGPDGVDRDFYVRQLRDWKFSAPIEQMIPEGMTVYARLCGWTLARAHVGSARQRARRNEQGSVRSPAPLTQVTGARHGLPWVVVSTVANH